MAHSRQVSELGKVPHSVSLKVLRLSKPQLSFQYPLPRHTTPNLPQIDPLAALSYPAPDPENEFILSPLLTLPSSFGVLHVGETFSCTLCVNNELPANAAGVSIHGLRLSAVMQTPSQPHGVPLELEGVPTDHDRGVDLASGDTFACIARFDLREDGTHILQPTVTYNETTTSSEENAPRGGRVRTFRKLYQFVAQQLLSVRTKAQPVAGGHVLEAQIENIGDVTIVIEEVRLTPDPHFQSLSLNVWDIPDADGKDRSHENLHLHAGEIQQACFMLKNVAEDDMSNYSLTRDGRIILGQLAVDWRGPMGEKGSLSTGWLSTRRR